MKPLNKAAAFVVATALFLSCAAAAEKVAATPSGLPVPRYAELKYERTHCRTGPTAEHPIRITYVRAAIPVRIVAETNDHWRKISDVDGASCWVRQAALRASAHVIVLGLTELRAKPQTEAKVRARLDKGVLAAQSEEHGHWRKLSVGGVSGWTSSKGLWGAAD